MSRPLISRFIRVACITERDPISHHPRAAEKPRPLERVFAEAVADPVHRRLQSQRARLGGPLAT